MSMHLQRDLEALEQNLLNQSSVVEQMVFRACQSLRLETQQGYGQYEIAGNAYYGAEFTVRVWG